MLLFAESWLSHPTLMWGMGGFSVLAVVLSILLVPRYVASLPQDFLQTGERQSSASTLGRVLRNVVGVVLVLFGIAMLVLPGQGLLTLLVGVLLVDFPGKRRVMRRILGRPKVLGAVNKLRARRGAPPLLPC